MLGGYPSCPDKSGSVPRGRYAADMTFPGSNATPRAAARFRRALYAWAGKHRRDFPWRRSPSPYGVLVAEILLQQTFARKVVPVYTEFMRRYPTPAALAAATHRAISALLHPLGLAYRARLLPRLGREIADRHGGAVPSSRGELLSLPGVGPYTAGAVLAFAFGRPEAVVDTNVVRVLCRFFGLPAPRRTGEATRALWEFAARITPRRGARRFYLALLDFAATVCTHYNPKCPDCPLAPSCRYFYSGAKGPRITRHFPRQKKSINLHRR